MKSNVEYKIKVRKSSRAIVLNKDNQIFLFQYKFDYLADNNVIWITPGGSLEDEQFTYAHWTESEKKRTLFEF